MYTFVVVVDESRPFVYPNDLLLFSDIHREEPGSRFVVEHAEGMKYGWLAIYPSEEVIHDYEDADLVKIFKYIKHPRFFIVEGRDVETDFANEFILNLSPELGVVVDNNHGVIAPVEEFKCLVNSKIGWLHNTRI